MLWTVDSPLSPAKAYWCLEGNGWEWGNGTIIKNYYRSFPHFLPFAPVRKRWSETGWRCFSTAPLIPDFQMSTSKTPARRPRSLPWWLWHSTARSHGMSWDVTRKPSHQLSSVIMGKHLNKNLSGWDEPPPSLAARSNKRKTPEYRYIFTMCIYIYTYVYTNVYKCT